jgi:hypothetical protein
MYASLKGENSSGGGGGAAATARSTLQLKLRVAATKHHQVLKSQHRTCSEHHECAS